MRIKLVFPPSRWMKKGIYCRHDRLPPLGMAICTSYLRSKGIYTDQDDLDIKVFASEEVSLNEAFTDQKIDSFLKGNVCEEIENQFEKAASLTVFNNLDAIGLSLSRDIKLALCFAKYLKKNLDI